MALAAVILVLHVRGRLKAASARYALVGLTLLGLLVSEGSSVTQLGDAGYWQYDARIIDLVREKAGSYRADVLGTKSSQRIDLQEVTEPAHQAIYWLLRSNPVMYAISSATGYWSPLRLARFEGFFSNVRPRRANDMASVKVILTWGKPTADQEAALREVYSAGMLHVYENPDALPRAYLAHRVEAVPDSDAALLRLTKDDFDPTQSTVIEGSLQGSSPTGKGISPVDIRLYSPLRVVVESESPQDGLLVLTDSHYPGWRAFVDGQEKPILHANYLFRGVSVPAGRHTVEFVYYADSFKAGLLISGATLILLLLLAIRAWRRA
jgi:hypothetical protein